MNDPTGAPPGVGAFPAHVMEALHAELAVTYLGALVGMAGAIVDLAVEHGASADEAQRKAAAALRSAMAEGPELLATISGRPFQDIVNEFVQGARIPGADGSCRAASLLDSLVRAAR